MEQQTVEELREQITSLQNELAEQKRHVDKMDDLAWENLKDKEKLEKELEKEKKEKEQVKKELEAKNRTIDDLQKELDIEKGWWDKWNDDASPPIGYGEYKYPFTFQEEPLSIWEFNQRKKFVFYLNAHHAGGKEPVSTFSERGGRTIDDLKTVTYEYYKNK